MKFWVGGVLLLMTEFSLAVDVLTETSDSGPTQSNVINLSNYSSVKQLEKSSFNHWSFSASSSITNDSSKVSRTNEYSGEFGWGKYKPWDSTLAVNTSRSPADALESMGVDFEMGFLKEFSKDSDSDEDDTAPFKRSLRTALKFGKGFYSAPLVKVEQTKVALNLRWKALDWFIVKLAGTAYDYSRDPGTVTSGANNNLIKDERASNALSSLNTWDASLTLNSFFADRWTVENYFKNSVTAKDGKMTNLVRLAVSYYLSPAWNLGVGWEQSQTTSSVSITRVATLIYNQN